jgi:hypothetical protein
MKKAIAAGSAVSGVVATVLAARGPALATLAAVILAVIGAICWVVSSRDRTTNTVDLISAARQHPGATGQVAGQHRPPGT